jgi:hypothetical protein
VESHTPRRIRGRRARVEIGLCVLGAASVVVLWAAIAVVPGGSVLLVLASATAGTLVLRSARRKRHWQERRPRPLRERVVGLAARVLAALVAVCLLPVLVAIGVAVKATSRGPVLVRQPRRRSDGAEYPALVFRTASTEAGQAAATSRPGITPVGELLRRYSLADLPRLLDIARGDVPLVRGVPAEASR